MLLFIIIVLIAFILQRINASLDDECGMSGPNHYQHPVWSKEYRVSSEYHRPRQHDVIHSHANTEEREDVGLSMVVASMTGSIAAGYAAGESMSGAMMGAMSYDIKNDVHGLDHNESSWSADPCDHTFPDCDFGSTFNSDSGFDHGSNMWD